MIHINKQLGEHLSLSVHCMYFQVESTPRSMRPLSKRSTVRMLQSLHAVRSVDGCRLMAVSHIELLKASRVVML